MTTHINDEDLAGYVLNELGALERQAVEQALREDPEVQARLKEFEWAAQRARESFAEAPGAELTGEQRDTILREAQLADAIWRRQGLASLSKKRWIRWQTLALAAGMLVLLGVLSFTMLPTSTWSTNATQKAITIQLYGGESADAQQRLDSLRYGGRAAGGMGGMGGGGGGMGGYGGRVSGGNGVYGGNLSLYEHPGPAAPVAAPAPPPVPALTTEAAGVDVNGDGANAAAPTQVSSAALPEGSEPDRYLIKTATLTMEAEDVKQAAGQITAAAIAAGGYVSDTRESVDPYGQRNATVVVRVPADKLDSALQGVEALGRVISNQVTAEDVTEDYVDTDARIRNLTKTEERLVDHLSKTSSIENTLKIEQEMTRVRGELERLQGHMRFMSHRIAYSTIQVTITEKPKAGPITPPETFSSVRIASQALLSLVLFGQSLWIKIIWLGIWTPVWGALVIVAWIVYRRIRKRNA